MYIAVVLILVLFYFSMSTVPWMKRPLGQGEDVEGYLDDLASMIRDEKWEEATGQLPELEEAWDQVSARLQLVLERNEMNRFSSGLVRLEVAIDRRDVTRALTEIAEMKQVWQEMGK